MKAAALSAWALALGLAAPGMLHAAVCISTFSAGNVCTANDLDAVTTVVAGPQACTAGTTIQTTIRVVLAANAGFLIDKSATERYDLGFFVGNGGESPVGGSDCTVSALTPLGPPLDLSSGSGPYPDLDGDACGDFQKTDPETVRDIPVDSLLCRDEDGDGKVDLDLALTWKGPNQACTDPSDPAELLPEQPSKCRLLEAIDIGIRVEPPPAMSIHKTAVPASLPEPGGTVSYDVTIVNNSGATDPLTVTSLVDDLYGDLDGLGSCALPMTLQPGEVRTCSFDEQVTDVAGQTIADVVTATAADDEGEPVSATAQASVSLVPGTDPIVGQIDVTTFAAPPAVLEPGGVVTVTVLIVNVSRASVEITSLVDDHAGNLAGQGNCALPQTLRPGAGGIYLCQYQTTVLGAGGDSQLSTVTAAGTDESGNPVSGSDPAVVTILERPARMMVHKIAEPAVVLEPGADVTFTVSVQNTSFDSVLVLQSLVDNAYDSLAGKGSCAFPQTLAAAGGTYECSFTAPVAGPGGSESTDTVTAIAAVQGGGTLEEQSGATVRIANLQPAVLLIKSASPSAVVAPGGPVTFTITIVNLSRADAVTLTSLSDSISGDLHGVGSCAMPQALAAAGGTYSCSFTRVVGGIAGEVETDTVTVLGTGDEGELVAATDVAEVTILDSIPAAGSIQVRKLVSPTEVPEPGDVVEWSVEVANNGDVAVTLDSLLDSRDGNLDGVGSCDVPQTLPVGGAPYLCRYTSLLTGNAGDVVTGVVTGSGTDASANLVTAQGSAAVTITNQPSSLRVTKLARPSVVDEPGDAVLFDIAVFNTSPADTVTVSSLVDSVHGNLDGQGTCQVPQSLPAGAPPYRCQFTAFVGGVGGDKVFDTVVASGTDDDRDVVAAEATAEVDVLDTPPVIALHKRALPNVVGPGGQVTFRITVTNVSKADAVTLVELDDDTYGNLDGKGTCTLPQTLPVGASYVCEFAAVVGGAAPAAEVDRVRAVATSARREESVAIAQGSAIVLILEGGALAIPALSTRAMLLLVLLLAGAALRKLGGGGR